jgi:peptidoglycan/xylan/chitin deacetylase (PgdA/CDA1 family)
MPATLLQRATNVVTRNLPVKWARSRLPGPVASITFDDFPKSAWTVAGPLLAKRGAKATYYVAGSFCGETRDGMQYYDQSDLRALHSAGHEIGAHGFVHVPTSRVASPTLLTDADRNAAFLQSTLGGDAPCSYAYPYGDVTPRTKILSARRFACARGIRPGVNAGMIDLAQLKAIPLERRRWIPDEIDAAVASAKDTAGWIIFFTHDVSEDASPLGCTPAMLTLVLERLEAAGIEVLPVKHAMAKTVFGNVGRDVH